MGGPGRVAVSYERGTPVLLLLVRRGLGGLFRNPATVSGMSQGQASGASIWDSSWLTLPLSNEFDTHKTVKTRIWPWLWGAGESWNEARDCVPLSTQSSAPALFGVYRI